DAATGKLLRQWEVGVAPHAVVVTGRRAYVSNWGGRRPGPDDLTGPAGRGTHVRVDPVRHIANEGSISIIELGEVASSSAQAAFSEIRTGLHPCAMAISPNDRWLVIANAGSDTLSVIDNRTEQLVETFSARQNPADLFGAQPNALAFDETGRNLFVCNGTQNAIAVFDFDPGQTKLRGLIPVGWFPGAVAYDRSRRKLCVANTKGYGSMKRFAPGETPKYNSRESFGTLSLVPLPNAHELTRHTAVALANMRYP